MADPRFFTRAGPFKVSDIALQIGAQVPDGVDADRLISDLEDIATASDDSLCFVTDKKYLPQLAETRAAAVLVGKAHVNACPPHIIALACDDPYAGMARVAQALSGGRTCPTHAGANAGGRASHSSDSADWTKLRNCRQRDNWCQCRDWRQYASCRQCRDRRGCGAGARLYAGCRRGGRLQLNRRPGYHSFGKPHRAMRLWLCARQGT